MRLNKRLMIFRSIKRRAAANDVCDRAGTGNAGRAEAATHRVII